MEGLTTLELDKTEVVIVRLESEVGRCKVDKSERDPSTGVEIVELRSNVVGLLQ